MLPTLVLSYILALSPTVALSPAPDAQAASATTVTGTVQDPDGAVVAGAVVILRSPSGAELQTVSGPDGHFSVTMPGSGALSLIVRTRGFADAQQTVAAGGPHQDLVVKLTPASVTDSLTVTPTRTEQRMGSLPASATVVDRDDIRQTAGSVADDVLREIPTFSLFRRTSSLVAHPTTQGVSLRGIGPSGVSRTLVLLDGVPINDPFGGWVYWTRIPLESASRIEVVEGSTASVYGNYAMGGVINVVTAPAARRTVELKTQYGELGSPRFDVVASDVWRRVSVVFDGSAFKTDGYKPVAEKERGPVDTFATASFQNANLKLQYDASDRLKAFFRGGYFEEDRDNGKVSTFDGTPEANHTRWATVNGGITWRLRDHSTLDATTFVDNEVLRSNNLAVPNAVTRDVGRMSLNQRVPTTGTGGIVQWSRTFGTIHAFSAGTDWRWVKGDSQEEVLNATNGLTVTLNRVSGGRQRSLGGFVQDVMTLSPDLTVTLSARGDAWRNYDGHNLETNVPAGTPGAGNKPSLPERKDSAASPKGGALYRLTDRVSAWGSFGTGFRAPTLNELYRQFRVGARLTQANDQLGPERLKSGELGVRVQPLNGLTWRATWFDNRMTDPVSNVTIAVNTLQRQNLGATEIVGIQNDVEYRIDRYWSVAAGYLYNSAKVTENSANTALVGLYLPQVPKHRGSVEVTFSRPEWFTANVMVFASGLQYDDDLNTASIPGYGYAGLPKYGTLSFTVSRQVAQTLEVFASVQNLFDQTYYVGTGPSLVGSPRIANVGLRLMLRGK